MRIYLQRQRFFFWKGWGSAGLPECAGLAELLEEVAYFSRFQENGLMRCSPFFGLFFRSFSFWLYVLSSVFCLLESFFSFYIFLSAFLSFNFDYLAFGAVLFSFFLLVFTAYFLPTPLHPRLPLFSPWFLSPSLSLTLFSFYLLLPPLTFLSFVFSFFLPSSFSVFSSRLVLFFFSCFFSLISLLTFLYPLSRPSQFSIVLLCTGPAHSSPRPEPALGGAASPGAPGAASPARARQQRERPGLTGDDRRPGPFSLKRSQAGPGRASEENLLDKMTAESGSYKNQRVEA